MRWYQLLLDIWRKENRGIWQTVILSSFHVDFMYMVYLFFQSDGTCPGLCLMHPITLHSSHLIRYCAQSFSRVWPFVTPWTIACQVPLSMRLSWQEYWNGLPFPPPGIFLAQGSNMSLCISSMGRWILYHHVNWEAPMPYWSEVKSLSCVPLFATPWTVAYHVPPSMWFSRQEYWSGLPFPSPEDLPYPGIKPGSPAL